MPMASNFYFNSKKDVLMLPACEPDSKTPYAWYKHASEAGFYVRASKADASGRFEKRYILRYKEREPGAGPAAKPKEVRLDLGPVVPGPKIDYDEALRRVLEKRKSLKEAQADGVTNRLTVAGAWAFYATERFTNKEATKEKDNAQYERYLSYLGDRYLDELTREFWSTYMTQLREGKLVVGTRVDKHGATVPAVLGPLRNATLIGVMNTAALLYELADKYGGLHGAMAKQNPPASLRRNIGVPKGRSTHIPLKDLGTAWRAADQLVSPWWRDMFRVFVLTGLRRSLLLNMRFDEIDFDAGVYVIAQDKRGAKRKGAKIEEDAEPIRLPLSKFVINIIKARREFAADKQGLVWFTPKPTRGRRKRSEIKEKNGEQATLSDPRTAWTLLEEAIGGLHFSPHDLRRTFATVGTAVVLDLFAVSLLMLHTGEDLAKAAGIPAITIKYMYTPEAIDRMRNAAEMITAHVLKLAAMPEAQAREIEDPVLPRDLEDALVEAAA